MASGCHDPLHVPPLHDHLCGPHARKSLIFVSSCSLYLIISLTLATTFLFPLQMVFKLTHLNVEQWMVVLKLSFPVILIDEVLKFVARNYLEGEFSNICKWGSRGLMVRESDS